MSEKTLLTPGYNITKDPDFKNIVKVLNHSTNLISEAIYQLKFKNRKNNKPFKGFMGGHPVSMNKQNLQPIKDNPHNFLICEKSDGVRYMMISLNNGMSFLMGRSKTDRNTNNYFLTNFENLPRSFYHKDKLNTKNLALTNVFDGELVRDEISGKYHHMYLLFDTIQCGANGYVPSQAYEFRLEMAQRYIESLKTLKKFDESYYKGQKKESFLDALLKPFPEVNIKFKDFYNYQQIPFLFKEVINKEGILPHGNDGLIFTQNYDAPYINGANRKIIKWKPPHMNTIDFAVLPNFTFEDTKYKKRILDLYVSFFPKDSDDTQNILFDFMFVSEQEFDKIYERLVETEQIIIAECNYNNDFENPIISEFLSEFYNFNDMDIMKLIEMAVDDQAQELKDNENAIHILNQSLEHRYKLQGKGNWVIERIREDKDHPNMLRTASSIWDSIIDNLTEEQLVRVLQPKLLPGQKPLMEKKKWKVTKQVKLTSNLKETI